MHPSMTAGSIPTPAGLNNRNPGHEATPGMGAAEPANPTWFNVDLSLDVVYQCSAQSIKRLNEESMNKQAAAALLVLGIGAPHVWATDHLLRIQGSTNDLWDVNLGTVVLNSSAPARHFSGNLYQPEAIFGRTFPALGDSWFEFTFQDGRAAGFTHFVEWRTLNPVRVERIHVFAAGDGPVFNNQREFARMVISAKSAGSSTFDRVLVDYTPTHPYSFVNPTNNWLLNLPIEAVVAQEFRAEFVDRGNTVYSGPRVIELDAYGSSVVSNPPIPQAAVATAQVVNGFVVGAAIVNAGYGYAEVPSVAFVGGGGSGALGRAVIENGSVKAITILNPGSGYTNPPTITIDLPPIPPRRAIATPQVVNGFVVGALITDQGAGYPAPPVIRVLGGGGTGAHAVAIVENGILVGISIVNPGSGYTSMPRFAIASPPFSPTLAVEVSRVKILAKVNLGATYRIDMSTNFQDWVPAMATFVAEDEELTFELEVDTTERFFRIIRLL
jgi:hypothetical protein